MVDLEWLGLVLALLLEFVTRQIGGVAPFVGGILFALLVALEANGLRRWTMERRPVQQRWPRSAQIERAGSSG